jgi:hypothetical protein
MTRLKILYLNVDTLYPRAWTADLERRLLAPMAAVTQVNEMCIILRWREPQAGLRDEYPRHVKENISRVDDYETVEGFCKACRAAEMGSWIMHMLAILEAGDVLGRKDSLIDRGRAVDKE